MSAPTLPTKALVSVVIPSECSSQNAFTPAPESFVSQPQLAPSHFCGESAEAVIRSAYRGLRLTEKNDALKSGGDLTGPFPKTSAAFLATELVFPINGTSLVFTLEEVIQRFKQIYNQRQRTFSDIQIIPEQCFDFFFVQFMEEHFGVVQPELAQTGCRQISILLKQPAELPERQSHSIAYEFLNFLSKRYLIDHIPLRVEFNHTTQDYNGFRSVWHLVRGENAPAQIKSLQIVPGIGLEPKCLSVQQLMKNAADREHAIAVEGLCDALFQQAYQGDIYKLLGQHLTRCGTFKVWELSPYPKIQCRDRQGNLYTFALSPTGAPSTTKFSMQLRDGSDGKHVFILQQTLQELFDTRFKLLREVSGRSCGVETYCDYWLGMTRGSVGVDVNWEKKLQQTVQPFVSRQKDPAKALADCFIECAQKETGASPEQVFAFFFNATAHLPDDVDVAEREKIWSHLSLFLEAHPSSKPFYGTLSEALVSKTLSLRVIKAFLEIVAIRSLSQPLSERKKDSLQCFVEEHNRSYIAQIQSEGATFPLSIKLERALDILCRETPVDEKGQAALQKLASFAPACNSDAMHLDSPLVKQAHQLEREDFPFAAALKASESANGVVRGCAQELLLLNLDASLKADSWKELVIASSKLIVAEKDTERSQWFLQKLLSKLRARFQNVDLSPLETCLNRHHNQQEFCQALGAIPREPFFTAALEIWCALSYNQKRAIAKQLLHKMALSSPLTALAMVEKLMVNGLENNMHEEESESQLILEMQIPLFSNLEGANRLPVFYGYVDLAECYAKVYPNALAFVPAIVKAFFANEPQDAESFLLACRQHDQKKKPLLLSPILSEVAELLAISSRPLPDDKVTAIIGKLNMQWLLEKEGESAELFLVCFEYLVLHYLGERSGAAENWVFSAVTSRLRSVRTVAERFFEKGLLKQNRKTASLLLNCCEEGLKQQPIKEEEVLALIHFAREKIWEKEDYNVHFERFLILYRRFRMPVLRQSLLDVQPTHRELSVEVQAERLNALKEVLRAPYCSTSGGQLLDFLQEADAVQEAAFINEVIAALLPHLWRDTSVLSALRILKHLQTRYPKVNFLSALTAFPVATAAQSDFIDFAKWLPSTIDPESKNPHSSPLVSLINQVVQRLTEMREMQVAMDLLHGTAWPEDALWLQCLQAVVRLKNSSVHNQALLALQGRRKMSTDVTTPAYEQMRFDFNQLEVRLLVSLSLARSTEPHFKENLKMVLERARDSQDRDNVAFAASQFMARRLYNCLEILLGDPVERYVPLLDEIQTVRSALSSDLAPHIDAKQLSLLDKKRAQCALRSKSPEIIQKGMEIVLEWVNRDTLPFKMRELQELIATAIEEGSPYLSVQPSLVAPLVQLCQGYKNKFNEGQHFKIIALLIASNQKELQEIACEIALKISAADASRQTHYEQVLKSLAEYALKSSLSRLLELIDRYAGHLTDKMLAEWICAYLETSLQLRKPSEPLDAKGLKLLTQHQQRLKPPFRLKCMEKAVPHLILIFDHPSAFPQICRDFFSYFLNLRTSAFRPVPFGLISNMTITQWLQQRTSNEDRIELSPTTFFMCFSFYTIQTWANSRMQSNFQLLEEVESKLQGVIAELDNRFGDIKLLWNSMSPDAAQPKNSQAQNSQIAQMPKAQQRKASKAAHKDKQGAFTFEAYERFLTTCLELAYGNLRPKETWTQALLMAQMNRAVSRIIEHYPEKHHSWMPLFYKFALCPVAFADDEVCQLHLEDVAQLIRGLHRSPHQFLDKHASVEIQLIFFLQYEMRQDSSMRSAQIAAVEELCQFLIDSRIISSRVPIIFHYACRQLFIHKSAAFEKWYGHMLDLLGSYRERPYSILTLQCSLKDDILQLDAAYPLAFEIHRKRWRAIMAQFLDLLDHEPQPTKNDQVIHNAYTSAWDYFLHVCRRRFFHESHAQFLADTERQLLLHLGTWNQKAIAQKLISPTPTEKFMETARHCNQLCLLKESISPSNRDEGNRVLHRAWCDTMAHMIECIKTAPAHILNGAVTFGTDQAQREICAAKPACPSFCGSILSFWETGRSLFEIQGDDQGYYHTTLTLGLLLLDQLPNHRHYSPEFFLFVFKWLTDPFKVPSENEPNWNLAATALVALITQIEAKKSPYAQTAAYLYLIKKGHLQTICKDRPEVLAQADSMVRAFESQLPQNLLGMMEYTDKLVMHATSKS